MADRHWTFSQHVQHFQFAVYEFQIIAFKQTVCIWFISDCQWCRLQWQAICTLHLGGSLIKFREWEVARVQQGLCMRDSCPKLLEVLHFIAANSSCICLLPSSLGLSSSRSMGLKSKEFCPFMFLLQQFSKGSYLFLPRGMNSQPAVTKQCHSLILQLLKKWEWLKRTSMGLQSDNFAFVHENTSVVLKKNPPWWTGTYTIR